MVRRQARLARAPTALGKALYDPGVTGLALCAFLGAGYTNRGRHPFAKTVSKGLRYLKNVQDAEGCFGPRTSQHYIYNHATASLAMVEAYGMTGSPIFKGSAQKCPRLHRAVAQPVLRVALRREARRQRHLRHRLDDDGPQERQAHQRGRQVKRGKNAPLTIDEEAFDGIKAWIEKMTDPDYGRTGYIQRGGAPARPQELIDRFPGDKSESMTGVGMLARIFIGEDPRRSEIIKKGAELCATLPPTWNPQDGSIDMYYWYYATLAMFQVGGANWKTWNEHLKTAVIDNQRKDTDVLHVQGLLGPDRSLGSGRRPRLLHGAPGHVPRGLLPLRQGLRHEVVFGWRARARHPHPRQHLWCCRHLSAMDASAFEDLWFEDPCRDL